MTYLTGKLAQLTEELFGVTQRGKMAWQAAEAEGRYVTQIRDLSITVEKITGADGLPGIALLIRNREGRMVQKFTDHDLADHSPESEEHRNFWDMLTELHEMARWSAEGVFEVIEDLMEALAPEPGLLVAEEPERTGPYSDYGWAGRAVSTRVNPAGLR